MRKTSFSWLPACALATTGPCTAGLAWPFDFPFPFLLGALPTFCPPIFPERVHCNIFQVSPSFLFPPNTAEASYPACTMQSSQRGSRPLPYFSHGVLLISSLKVLW